MDSEKQEIIVHIHKEQSVMKQYNPWRWYKYGFAIGFGVTFVSNILTAGMSEVSLIRYPITFAGSLLMKSLFYG